MLSRILELLRRDGALTIAELARATGASDDALRGMLDTLARRRLIEWHGTAASTRACGAAPKSPPVVVLRVDRESKNKAPGRTGGKWTAKTRGR